MLVIGQIESVKGWENLDEILSVKGLSGITGGPNDLAASMGLPGEPDHKERVELTKKIDDKARKQKKIVASDITNTIDIHTLMLDNARTFVEKNS